jgi:hypothetical protein
MYALISVFIGKEDKMMALIAMLINIAALDN